MSKNEEISIDTIKAILEDIRLSLKVQRNEIMNIDECALYLGLETTTLYNYCNQRKIPHYKRGNRIRFKKIEVDEWQLGKRVEAIDPEAFADNYCIKKR